MVETGGSWADEGGFLLATVLGSVLSFLLINMWVFNFPIIEASPGGT